MKNGDNAQDTVPNLWPYSSSFIGRSYGVFLSDWLKRYIRQVSRPLSDAGAPPSGLCPNLTGTASSLDFLSWLQYIHYNIQHI